MKLIYLLNSFISIGTQDKIDLYEIRRIKSLNILYLVSIFSAFTYLLIFISVDSSVLYSVIISSTLFILFNIFGVIANKLNKLLLSQHMLCFALTFVCAYNTFAYLGTQTYNHFYFLLFALVPILIWNRKQLFPIILYFVINEICFIYTEFFWQTSNTIQLPESISLIISIFTVIITFTSLMIVLGFFIKLIQENELLLLKQKKELTDSNNTKNILFSIIAHDLRSPFNAILGLSKELSTQIKEYNSDEILHFAKSIYTSSEQTFLLVENLLEWSKSQTNMLECNPSKFLIQDLITEIHTNLNDKIEAKQISFYNEIKYDLEVILDKNIIKTVLRNLITNAIKYTENNGIISLNIEKENNCISIHIQDNGIGIENKQIENIFTISNNKSSFGTNNERGSGIGLVLCKILIEKHNGTISIQSTINKGTTVTCTFPQ